MTGKLNALLNCLKLLSKNQDILKLIPNYQEINYSNNNNLIS